MESKFWVVLLTLLFGWVKVQGDHQTGAYFIQRGQLYYSNSAWRIVFALDLDIFSQAFEDNQEMLDYLNSMIENFRKNAPEQFKSVITNIIHTHKVLEHHLGVARSVIDKIKALNYKQHFKTESYRRAKRALLPFIGKFYHALYGLTTDEETRYIQQKIKDLNKNHQKVAHIVQELISIVNLTSIQVETNTVKIDQFTHSLRSFSKSIKQLQGSFSNHEIRLDVLSFQIQLTQFTGGLSANILSLLSSVLTFSNHFETLVSGSLPQSFIRPGKLYAILSDIRSNLHLHQKMPFNLETDLLSYYVELKTKIIIKKDVFALIIEVPIVMSNSLTYYRTLTIPIPALQDNVSSLAYQLQVEKEFLALSEDEQYYSIFDYEVLDHCVGQKVKFCNSGLSLRLAAMYPSCILALFFSKDSEISRLCTKKVVDLTYPTITQLSISTWVVSSTTEFIMHKICSSKVKATEAVNIKPGITKFVLPMLCEVISKYLKVPSYYLNESRYEFYQKYFTVKMENISLFSPNITVFSPLQMPMILKGVKGGYKSPQMHLSDLHKRTGEVIKSSELLEKELESQRNFNMFSNISSFFVLVGIIAVVAAFFYCKVRGRLLSKFLPLSRSKSNKRDPPVVRYYPNIDDVKILSNSAYFGNSTTGTTSFAMPPRPNAPSLLPPVVSDTVGVRV